MSGKRGKGEERLSPGRILVGGVLGLCLVLLVTLGAAVLISRERLPMGLCQGVGFAALLLGSFFASLFAAWHSCKKLLPWGDGGRDDFSLSPGDGDAAVFRGL